MTTAALAPAAVTVDKLAPGAVGAAAINPTEVQQRVTGTCPAGQAVQIVNQDGTVGCATTLGGNWSLSGNAGTTPGTNFLGTTDSVALEVKVESQRAWRVEPATDATFGFSPNLIGGVSGNTVSGGVAGATIGGGGSTTVSTCGPTSSALCINQVTAKFATVGGGRGNTASGDRATVGGGSNHTASGLLATVAGGNRNTASGPDAAVGGGENNVASGLVATVGGGLGNTAGGLFATVSGGSSNTASVDNATVGGGQSNAATGVAATVGGGITNTASGTNATVPGGASNTALGTLSFAAGNRAKANHQGAFVWADSTAADFASSAADEFDVRAAGGTRIFSAGNLSTGVTLAPGSGTWAAVSDRAVKENFRVLDGRAILRRLSEIPILEWNYKTQAPTIRHVGPMAQDFYAAFGLGEDDRRISTVDADGVALAAIQTHYELSRALEVKTREIDELRARLEALERRPAPVSPDGSLVRP